jgi:hypothetical protein
MSFVDKVAENKRVAEKCMEIKAYNAGVTRAYYSAFLRIKGYLIDRRFDYKGYLRQAGSNDREFSHGTLQAAAITCLMENGKEPIDVYKLVVLSSLYEKRIRADYHQGNIIEAELKTSLNDLDIVLSVVT